MIRKLVELYGKAVGAMERRLQAWLPGLLARFVFAGVLLVYFLNSAMRKIGEGFPGVFTVSDSAWFQIVPSVVERYGANPSEVPVFPWALIVYAGTYAEILLPVLIVVGLFTRLAALGMIVFVLVQSYVDIVFHDVGSETVGALFDRLSDSTIMDQRSLWIFLLVYLVVCGPGRISVDHLLARRLQTGR